MKLLTVLTVLILAGCSSVPKVESTSNVTNQLDYTYCNQEGFSKFYESNNRYYFTCNTGSKFSIDK